MAYDLLWRHLHLLKRILYVDISPLFLAIRKGHFVFFGKRLSDILTLDISVVYLICQFNKAFEQILNAHCVVAVCRFFSDVPARNS